MLYDPFVRIVYAIIIFNIFRLGLKILNNCSKLEIFNQQNAAIMRFSTLEKICKVLHCDAGELLSYKEDEIE